MAEETKRRRTGGRRVKQVAAQTPARSPCYRQLQHPFTAQVVFSDEEIVSIHETALRVLEELGIKVLLPEAQHLFAAAGARVAEDMVFIGRDIVDSAITSAPSSFRLRAINPEREHIYENGSMLFAAGSGCPNAYDHERGRRPGDLATFEDSLKLIQRYDVIHMLGPTIEPQDVPIQFRHYAMTRAQLALSDKPLSVFARGHAQVQDCFEMIQTGLGLSDAEFSNDVWATTVINSNSPRLLDVPMAQGLIDFARAGQMAIMTPFCLAGAMAPISIAGALTLQHAEALAGITLAQITRAGAPISYGGFSSNVDMKSGAPAFGTPEHVKLQIGAGQLARHIGLPWRSATGAASNTTDMQAATETNMALWGACMANATLTLHAAGWLEGGLSFGFEKFINDVEALQILAEMCDRPSGSNSEIGFDAIAEVQPGGHFFAAAHTMDRFETAFYAPLVADLTNHGGWVEAGSLDAGRRATAIWKRDLESFTPPEGAEARAARIDDMIAHKTAHGGAYPQE